jgi:hypothetical protein
LHFTSLGLSHFDEGVYAFAGLWPWTGQFPTDQAFYSPPVYPLLIGLAGLFWGGPTDLAAPSVSWLLGTAAIYLVWQVNRRWVSPEAGLCAAWLVSLDGFQIALSRIGLTDATFQFEFLLSLFLIRSALAGGTRSQVLAAGLAVGFTWNTKYNGFLPLLLAVGWLPAAAASWRNGTTKISQITLISLFIYLPWAVWFHVKHGYGALIAHQRGYWVGPSGLASGWVTALVDLESVGAYPLLTLVLAAVGIGFQSRRERFASLWITGWLLVLPAMYTPYLRLWAPTELWLLLLAGGGLANLWRRVPMKLAPLVVGAILLAAFIDWTLPTRAARRWRPVASSGYREAGTQLSAWLKEHRRSAVGLVRPPLLFYLAQEGSPFGRLPDGPVPTLRPGQVLVFDRALADSAKAFADWQARQGQFREVARFPIEPYRMTLLDDRRNGSHDPAEYDVVVFEPKAP